MNNTATVQVHVAKGYKPLVFSFSEGQDLSQLISNFCSKFNLPLIVQKSILQQILECLPWNWCSNIEDMQQLMQSEFEESFIEENQISIEIQELNQIASLNIIDTPIQRLKITEEEKIQFGRNSSEGKNGSKKASTMGTETPVRWLDSQQDSSQSGQNSQDSQQIKIRQKQNLNNLDQKKDKKINKIIPLSFLSFRQASKTCFSPQGFSSNKCHLDKIVKRRQSQRYSEINCQQ